ncbi:uncharacterized protein Tco025E_06577 [Trypanosoma conorhini]|uniref:EF-hand domain-containing protein n=1 Tax=Trypanosoma conorhini TaxID=83891 RepID=A0A422P1W5_9TRYP|nr:uncharacterized protein Tco025E_06577 [Trypanosoma conorhini]RNF11726.1 hypothetical protein Tco025E_06577 [Trypanosoma conorhini]
MSSKWPASPVLKASRGAFVTRGTRGSNAAAGSVGREARDNMMLSMRQDNPTDPAVMPELSLEETMRVREVFSELVRDEYITAVFALRVVLSHFGMYPSDEELSLLLGVYENKISVTNLCHYLRFYKREFELSAQLRRGENPEGSTQDEIEDTLRAFVSLGGAEDGSGSVKVEDLRHVCHEFGLTIDIDSMLFGIVDLENQTSLNYAEFCDMWRPRRRQQEMGSMASVLESQLDVRSALRALGMDSSSVLRPSSMSHEGSSVTLRDDAGVEGYKFPQGAEPGSPGRQGQGSTHTVSRSEALHLQALKRFLVPETAVGTTAPDALPSVKRKGARRQSTQLALHIAALAEPDRRRSYAPNREEAANAGGGASGGAGIGGDNDDGGLPALTGATGGGYRAPSPMILSLRNSAAYKRRLQAFVQKSMKKKRARDSGAWSRFPSISPEEDGSRS